MVTMFFNPGWHRPEFLVLVEAYQMGADVGICLNPHSYRPWMKEVVKVSDLPVMVDNGAYQEWKSKTESKWPKAVEIAEDLEADYIVALDKIGSPEESLKLSLDHFGDTHIEKIVPFQAASTSDMEMIKRHLKLLLDNNVRVFGFPAPIARQNNTLKTLYERRWLVPRRCHLLGAHTKNKRLIPQLKNFHSFDVGLRSMLWEGGGLETIAENIFELQKLIYSSKQTFITQYNGEVKDGQETT